MRSINRVALLGRLVGETSVGAAGNKPVCNFSIETVEEWVGKNGPERRETIHACVAFGPIARAVESVPADGHIYVEGSIRAERGDASNEAAEIVCSVAIPVAEPAQVPA